MHGSKIPPGGKENKHDIEPIQKGFGKQTKVKVSYISKQFIHS